ncbi:hypothetical protein GCM10028814_02580 [Angustibacter aerolatus]
MFGWGRPEVEPQPDPAPRPVERTPADEAAAMQGELVELVRRVNRAGGRLPVGAVPTVRAVEDVLRPLLQYVEQQSANAEELHQLTAIVREYLPQAIDQYVALPEDYARRDRGGPGTSPADDLVAQLRLLLEGAQQLQRAVYESDAQELAIGRRFLDTKFRRSDLDL